LYRITGVGKQLMAMTDQHAASQVMVSLGEVTGSRADLG
jgi:hypothetical protein